MSDRHRQAPQSHQHLPPMPERDTKLFEVLIGQVAKNGGVDVTLGKALRVLGHACFRSHSAIWFIGGTLRRSGPARLRVYHARQHIVASQEGCISAFIIADAPAPHAPQAHASLFN